MTISRALIAKQLKPGLSGVLGQTYQRFSNQCDQVFEMRTSKQAQEEFVMTTGMGLAQIKPEGDLYAMDTMGEGYTARFVNQTFGLGYVVTEEAIEDNLYTAEAFRKGTALARSMAETKEIRGAGILNLAFDAGTPYGDGVALCANNHPLAGAGAGTYSNLGSADLDAASMKAALIAIRTTFVDDRGLKLKVNPKQLIVAPSENFNAFEILRSDLSTSTAVLGATGITQTNNVNSLKGSVPSTFVYDYLTDPDAWFIKTDADDGLIHYQRRKLTMNMSYKDPYTGNLVVTASERYSFGVGDARCIWGSPGV
jgi:hypothetical protein